MTRHSFCGDMASWAMGMGGVTVSVDGLTGNLALLIPGQQITFWDSETAGNQLTDLLDADGNPVTYVTSDAADGSIPELYGPDEVWQMWADASGGAGPRRLVVANDLATILQAVQTTQQQNLDAITFVQQTAPVFAYYNAASASYPTRPQTGVPVWWVGPVPPQFGGNYAVDGLDYWIGPSS